MSLTLTRATKTVDLCTNLSFKVDHERAVAALEAVSKASEADARETSTAVRDAADAVVAIERAMASSTVRFTLAALPRKRWVEFTMAHPPRSGDKTDEAVGVDVSALDEVIAASIVAVNEHDGTPVEFAPATEWVGLADEMSNSQWEQFSLATLALNNGSTSAPFSPAASLAILRSELTSKRRNVSA